MKRSLARSWLLCLLVLVSPLSHADNGALHFGVQGAAGQRLLLDLWQPLVRDLARSLARPVEIRVFDDYAGTVSAIREGQVQLAWLGNRAAIEAVDTAGAEIFAQVKNSLGVPGYYSLLLTQAQSRLENERDVLQARQRLRFGFGDPKSTSGTIVPLYFLFAEHKIDPNDFLQVRYANHEQNFHDVARSVVDVATISSVMLQRFQERHPEQAKQVKVIWGSPLIPTDPLLWRRDLDAQLKAEIRRFFLAYGMAVPGKPSAQVADEQSRLKKLKWSGFKASSNSQLRYVRILDLVGQRETLKTDQARSAEEREAAIEDIQAQIDQMEHGAKP